MEDDKRKRKNKKKKNKQNKNVQKGGTNPSKEYAQRWRDLAAQVAPQ